MRELFIEELAEVTGGGDAVGEPEILKWIRQQLVTTTACGEEIPIPWPTC
jgi:hypothetical protein